MRSYLDARHDILQELEMVAEGTMLIYCADDGHQWVGKSRRITSASLSK